MFSKMPSMIVPVLWMREIANVDEDTKNDLEKIVLIPRWVSCCDLDLSIC